MLLLLAVGCLFDSGPYEARVAALTDADRDGYARADDCDDGDAGVHPGAVETCDGVDEDCDGAVDDAPVDVGTWYPDVDADDFGAAAAPPVAACDAPAGHVANALDCDDGATDIHPGAAEVPYDGVDDDCDGADLTDVDGDGHSASVAGGDDCDDTDPDVSPSESEEPYDGVDQDCSGADADDLDADGHPAEAAGGDDCDDADPAKHPGAPETWADGFTDNDCDGAQEPARLEFGAEVWVGEGEGELLGLRVGVLGDIDGNGLGEVLLASEYDATLGPSSGAVYMLEGLPGGRIEDGRALYPDRAGARFATWLDAGVDVTGDGVPDVLASAFGSETEAGTGWLVDGARWYASRVTTVDRVLAGSIRGSGPGTYGGATIRFVGDVSGDGVTDIAVSECCGTAAGPDTRGRVVVFSSDGFAGTTEDADVEIVGPWDGTYIGGPLDTVGDQDGDGLPEILISGIGGLGGAVVGGTASGDLADLAVTLIYATFDEGHPTARSAGDLDGDGRDDVAILGDAANDHLTVFTAVWSAPARSVDSPTFTFSWSDNGGVASVVPVGDQDGDGRGELLVPQFFSDSGNQRVWLLEGSSVVVGGSLDADDVRLQGVSIVPTSGFGYASALVPDADGDGGPDLLLGAADYSAIDRQAGAATIVPVPR